MKSSHISKKIFFFCAGLFLCVVVIYLLFSSRPIVDDVQNYRIDMIQYNPYFNEKKHVRDGTVVVVDYDEKKILECLSQYKEQRIFAKTRDGFLVDDMELNINISAISPEKDSKILVLGNVNYSFGSAEKPKYHIVDADSLRSSLLNYISVEDKGMVHPS